MTPTTGPEGFPSLRGASVYDCLDETARRRITSADTDIRHQAEAIISDQERLFERHTTHRPATDKHNGTTTGPEGPASLRCSCKCSEVRCVVLGAEEANRLETHDQIMGVLYVSQMWDWMSEFLGRRTVEHARYLLATNGSSSWFSLWSTGILSESLTQIYRCPQEKVGHVFKG
ncbi:unnamed protein product [Ectocarpus sp. 6 AP-2014]